MALVSGGRSTLNPNAPLFVPAAMRQVEDFSPEWWDLVTTSTWFSDYWLSQNQGEDVFRVGGGFDVNNASRLLPDSIDLDVDEDILNMESQYEEFLQSSEAGYGIKGGRVIENGFNKNTNALVNMSKQRSPISPRGGMMYGDKPAQFVAPRYSPSFIQQPR